MAVLSSLAAALLSSYPPPLRDERHATHWSELVSALQQGSAVIALAAALSGVLFMLSTAPGLESHRFDLRFAGASVLCGAAAAFLIYYVSL